MIEPGEDRGIIFIHQLGRSIGRQGVRGHLLTFRQAGQVPVDGRRRCADDLLDPCIAGGKEDSEGAGDVDLVVEQRVCNRLRD